MTMLYFKLEVLQSYWWSTLNPFFVILKAKIGLSAVESPCKLVSFENVVVGVHCLVSIALADYTILCGHEVGNSLKLPMVSCHCDCDYLFDLSCYFAVLFALFVSPI